MSSDLFKVQLSFSVKTKRLLQARALVTSESFFLMKLTPSFSLKFWTAVYSIFYLKKKFLQVFLLVSHHTDTSSVFALWVNLHIVGTLSLHFQYIWDNPTSHQFCLCLLNSKEWYLYFLFLYTLFMKKTNIQCCWLSVLEEIPSAQKTDLLLIMLGKDPQGFGR